MTNEEKASEIVNKQWQWIADFIERNNLSKEDRNQLRFEMYGACIDMAQRKDEQFAKEKRELIDKACEWMDVFLLTHYIMRYHDCCEPCKDYIIEGFKQAMKGE